MAAPTRSPCGALTARATAPRAASRSGSRTTRARCPRCTGSTTTTMTMTMTMTRTAITTTTLRSSTTSGTRTMVRRRVAHRITLGAVLLATLILDAASGAAADAPTAWVEEFRSGRLDPARWERTHEGDFREWSVEVVDSIRRRAAGPDAAAAPLSPIYRLRLRADTRDTRDDT